MTKTGLLSSIKTKLLAQNWTGSSNPVFGNTSVVITKWISIEEALRVLRTPFALIIPEAGRSDPQFQEEPDLIIFPVNIRIVATVPGDTLGENPLLGANRQTNTSQGAGLYQIEQEVYNAIGKLNTQDSLTIQFRRTGDSGAVIYNNTYIAYEDHVFEAIATVV